MTMPADHPGDKSIEQFLEMYDVRWVLVEVDLTFIDRKASARNQARAAAHDPERIRRYTHALSAGAVFPPMVLWRESGDKLVVIDGNNRLAAYDAAGVTSAAGYVVTCSTTLRDVLTLSANAINGDPPTEVERRANAVTLASLGTYSNEQIATQTGLSPDVVRSEVRSNAVRDRLVGMAGVRTLNVSVLDVLYRIHSDAVLRLVAEAAIADKLTGGQVADIAKAVKAERSENAQMLAAATAIEGLREQRRQLKQPKRRTETQVTAAKRAISAAMKLDAKRVAVQVNGDAAQLRSDLERAAERLLEVVEAL